MKIFAAIIRFLKAVVIVLTVIALGFSVYFLATDKAGASIICMSMIALNGVLYVALINIGYDIEIYKYFHD